MNTAQQNKAWRSLPEDLKKEVYNQYLQAIKDRDFHHKEKNTDMYWLASGKWHVLENLYGKENLESMNNVFGIEVRMAVISHLSDAQEIGRLSLQQITVRDKLQTKKEQDRHINFAKRLLIKYKDDLNQEISEDELNNLWKDICNE